MSVSTKITDHQSLKKRTKQNCESKKRSISFVPGLRLECDSEDESKSKVKRFKQFSSKAAMYGFIGIGTMGFAIAKHLITAGFSVLIWNRTEEKCSQLLELGAQYISDPRKLIAMASVTFSCLSDPAAIKDVLFLRCAIAELKDNKGYVEFTTLDLDTSRDLNEVICSQSARYLEAQIQGSKNEIDQRTAILLTSGNKELHEECKQLFCTFSKNNFYFGNSPNAIKIQLSLQLMRGVSLVGLAEVMALAERIGIPLDEFIKILAKTQLSSTFLLEKAALIAETSAAATHSSSPPKTVMNSSTSRSRSSLKIVQKDLKLALQLGEKYDLPLFLASSANDVLSEAKYHGFSTHDVAIGAFINAKLK